MAILSVKLASEIKNYLDKIVRPVMLVASLDDSQSSSDYLTLLKELVSLSNKIVVRTDGQNIRKPSVQIQTTDKNINIHLQTTKSTGGFLIKTDRTCNNSLF